MKINIGKIVNHGTIYDNRENKKEGIEIGEIINHGTIHDMRENKENNSQNNIETAKVQKAIHDTQRRFGRDVEFFRLDLELSSYGNISYEIILGDQLGETAFNKTLEALKVSSVEELNGQNIKVKMAGKNGPPTGVAHISSNEFFDKDAFYKQNERTGAGGKRVSETGVRNRMESIKQGDLGTAGERVSESRTYRKLPPTGDILGF